MPRSSLALFAAFALAMCGRLCAQDREAVEYEMRPEASGDPVYENDSDMPPRRLRPVPERRYQESNPYCNGACEGNCDCDSPEQRCFDGHRLRNALSSMLPPAPPSTSSPTDSWNRYPLSAGWFLGGAQGSTIMSDWASMSTGVMGGVRMGWDINSNVGVEGRVAFGSLSVRDSARAVQAEAVADAVGGISADLEPSSTGRQGDVLQCDIDLLLYPWGDSRWRPYILFGLGTTSLHFDDALGQSYSTTGISMPLGIGLKYLWNDRFDIRFDLIDDVAFRDRSDFNTVNVLSFTGGIELRFGGSRQVYWPYDTGNSGW